MRDFEFIKIDNLLDLEIQHLLKESKEEGFRFLERLVNDYKEGSNTFKDEGELLMGVFADGRLIAIGGLNRDPFEGGGSTGRLRRFYVAKKYRRTGLGKRLVAHILQLAKGHFEVITLKTDTEQGDLFYRSVGFTKENRFPGTTHYLWLERHEN